MGQFLATLITLVVVLFAVGFYFSSKAKVQVQIETDLPLDTAASMVDGAFGKMLWRRVDGPGTMNFQRRMARYPGPVMSIDLTPGPNGTTVEVWMSHWTNVYGMAVGGEFAYVQRRKVLKAFDAQKVVPAA